MTTENAKILPHKKDDFVSGADVRWCPGCGDYSILSMMQRTLAEFDVPRENHVFVSGIGCSSRFPYYMNTYGFHTIHGRAPAFATGVKCSNPNLNVWVITGDGDGLSIGGNHLIHALRRNINLKICLVNNQIYGLTKGQYSPTSEVGKVTKSTPFGSIDHPVNALCLAIASEATFIARTVDTDPKHMGYVFERAMNHKGVAFIEIYQNCIIFNDKAHAPVTGRDTREDRMVYLEDGKPLIYGKNKDRAVRIKRLRTETVDLKEAEGNNIELLIHKENEPDPTHAYLLTQMRYPEKPVPFGVFRCISKPTYEEMLWDQVDAAKKKFGQGDLKKLIYGSETWTISEKTDMAKHVTTAGKSQAENMVPMGNPPREALQKVMMTAPISEIISKQGPALNCQKTDTLEVVVKLFQDTKKDSLVVMDNGKVAGIISNRDLLLKVAGKVKDLNKTSVGEVMTPNPESVSENHPIAYVVNKMAMGGFRHVPVLAADGKPRSIVSIKDVLCYLDTRDEL